MKSAILFYSFGGATRKEATKRAAQSDADIFEIVEAKKRGIFSAFLSGCPQALGRKASAIKALTIDWSLYDSVTLMAPVWAGSISSAPSRSRNARDTGSAWRSAGAWAGSTSTAAAPRMAH